MKPYTVSVSVTVDRPVAEVHELLDDLSAHKRWTDHFLVDWELIGDPHGVGAKARFKAKGGGAGSRLEIEVLESTPTRIVEEGRGGKNGRRHTRGIYELRPTPSGGTEITFTNEVLSPATRLEGLGAPVTKAYLRKQNTRAMQRLREILDQPAPVTAA